MVRNRARDERGGEGTVFKELVLSMVKV